MAAPDYFPEGHVSTDLEFVIAPPFRRRNLATRLLRGYVAWAKELEVPVIQCGDTTIFADDEQSRHFDAAGFRPVGDVLQYREDRSEEQKSELQSLMRNSYAVFCLQTKN